MHLIHKLTALLRGRFNRAFGVEAAGFSEGASCALRERLPEG